MDLVLWRHADAQEWSPDYDDMVRPLTARGEKQAVRMAAWLDRQLPDNTRIAVSPALRCEQTASALGRKFKIRQELAPHASLDDLLALVQWPESKGTLLLVGHQPTLGQAIGRLLGLGSSEYAIKKGSVWWLRSRQRELGCQTLLLSVQTPELL